jgi:hypothetical protein
MVFFLVGIGLKNYKDIFPHIGLSDRYHGMGKKNQIHVNREAHMMHRVTELEGANG